MADRDQLNNDLRTRLKDGSTPSALIQHILTVLGEAVSYTELCGVLQEAFSLPIARISLSSVTSPHDHRGITLNKTILMEMIQRRRAWDTLDTLAHSVRPSWMDGLMLRSPEAIASEVRASPVPGLHPKSWSSLSPEEQDALYVHLTSGIVLSQRVEVLARLVERLQAEHSQVYLNV
jgi:hypothetical protein